ncbi:hypothetical protein SELMODRAFT_236278 [Selaginella moellendorffii]|uniref:Signal peptide peptidase-like 3 n=1 Tax=Selaginella moellendorffii TaxID=88036 RepID=D8T731_SELML|nr:signal peptide peptidase-like 1 [Selaginella moellendorffii]EFJ07550.1 hypothetical protein SELMODRAFT_236278 [Selaginella moellendorffii]|eukprot:XP_002991438.1 signal peptide peptidase-like 1 [Selaginella moellendorffii]
MEPLWKLQYLLEPSSLALISTAAAVVFASAHRALGHEIALGGGSSSKEMIIGASSVTLDSSQALMIPLASSCSLLLMFYLFSSVSQIITLLTTAMAAASLAFCIAPYAARLGSPRIQAPLVAAATATAIALWLVSGHWLLNNLLGISICVAFVCHIRLPNVRVCALLLACLFVYDVFWVFWSERFFGANVMVSVATQQASNPVRTVADKLNLPGLGSITKQLDMPVKLVFPRHLIGGAAGNAVGDYLMLGLGDMAIPGMLVALVVCFDHRKSTKARGSELPSPKNQHKYTWYAQCGYTIGLICALAAGLLTHSAQPALLYLVPSTLGPVMLCAWMRGDFNELWNGSSRLSDKSQLDVV